MDIVSYDTPTGDFDGLWDLHRASGTADMNQAFDGINRLYTN